MVEAAHEKELKADETIRKLNDEIRRLTGIVQQHSDSMNQEDTVNELMKVRDVLMRKNEDATEQIQALNDKVDSLLAVVDKKRTKYRAKKTDITDLKQQIRQREAENERERMKKERLDKELRDFKLQLEEKSKSFADLKSTSKEGEEKVQQLEGQLREGRKMMEKYLRDFDGLYQNTQKLTEDLDEQMHRGEVLTEQNISLEQQLKAKALEQNKDRVRTRCSSRPEVHPTLVPSATSRVVLRGAAVLTNAIFEFSVDVYFVLCAATITERDFAASTKV